MKTTGNNAPAKPNGGSGFASERGFGAGAFLGIRPGEGRLAWLFFSYFLVLTTVHFAAKSVRQASFIDSIGAANLPYVYLAVALISYPVLLFYSRMASRFRHSTIIVGTSLLHALGLIVFFLLFSLGRHQPSVAVAYYIWLGMGFAIAVSQVWSYANHVFDPRQARRLFAFVGAGGLLGSIPGGLIAWGVTRIAGTFFTLTVAAAVMLAIPILVLLIERYRPNTRPAGDRPGRARVEEARGGLQIIRSSRLLVLITLLMLATVVVGQLVGWQFYWHVEQHTEETVRDASMLDARTSVIGGFFILMGIVGFIFQLFFTQRIHRVLGVGVGMRVLPATVGVVQITVLVALAALESQVLFALVVVLMLAEGSLRHSLDQATRELLFLPVPSDLRVRAKAFIDVFVQRFAKGLAALLILPVTFGWLVGWEGEYVGWLTSAILVAWLVLTGKVRSEYVREYRAGLKSGIIEPDAGIDTTDLTTITTLVQGLGSSDTRRVMHSLELLGANGQGHLVPPLLLHHADSRVRAKTLKILAETGREDAVELVKQAISDDDAEVRSGAMQTLAKLSGSGSSSIMRDRLDDPNPELRATAVAFLLSGDDETSADLAEASLARMVDSPDAAVRAEAARCLAEVPEPAQNSILLQLLYDSELSVVRNAIHSIKVRLDRDGPSPIYGPTLVSLMGNRRLKHEAREALVAIGEGAVVPLRHFMNSDDEQVWVRRAVPKTLALLGVQAAADALEESLDAGDSLLRSKIIEALCFMRARYRAIRFSTRAVKAQIRAEASGYLRCLADLWAISSLYEAQLEGPFAVWQKSDRVPTLPQQLLAQRMQTIVRHIFGLLELIEDPDDVRAARRSLMSRQAALRARALEYLDNSLSGSLRRDVFSVIDDAQPEEKLRRARLYFGVLMESPEATLDRLVQINPRTDPAARGIILAAMYAVWAEEVVSLYPLVERMAETADEPLVRETAQWVTARAGKVPPGTGLISKGETSQMTAMAHIEMMVFLQGVDLFAHCNAEQVLRLAAIAGEQTVAKGDEVFGKGEPPDTLYCVVEGRVRLTGGENGGTVVGPSGRFGVLDILSGRPRSGSAVAETEAHLLTIEAEDFFDLLSNNIDIVKALFRTVVSKGSDDDEALL
ncbi:MAG: Npt1/Npt2 family nucleotide transporter [Thermoanaerobaculales bacterium]|nr:Npt1/Npt2 family nucleotide transporter [Thermoanaerobaculales bacterium]